MSEDRAVSPVIGTVLLVAIVVATAALLGSVVLGVSTPEAGTQASVDLRVDPTADRITLVHDGGDPIDVASLTVRVTVDGEPLEKQPPVPFFSAAGFRPGPTGPFNVAAEGRWHAGQQASVRLAATNDPGIDPGDRVTVRLYDGDVPIAEVTTTA